MRKVQDSKTESEGSVLRYVTEGECRKQRGHLRMMTHRLFMYSEKIP
ncbi:hypothetical protein [Porphyromonas macacae]|nr:hypothetical protein [Porphyromonas macacae]